MHIFVAKNFWILAMFVNVINTIIIKIRTKKDSIGNPELEEGYNIALKQFVIFGNIPWIIMGIGISFNLTKNVFEYFRPRDLNPIVIAFHISILIIIILSGYWIYLKDGAEFLEKHKKLLGDKSSTTNTVISVNMIKIFWGLMMLCGIIGMVMLWIVEVPIINF